MGIVDTVIGIFATEGQSIAVDNVTSAAGGGIKKLQDEYELRKKVETILNAYCQGIQETLELDQEFDDEGLKKGSKELINSAKKCTVGPDRKIRLQQYFARGYSLAGVDLNKKNQSLDAILASVLNVVQEESDQAITINAVDEIHAHLDELVTREDISKLAIRENFEKVIEILEALLQNQHAEQNCKDFAPYYEYVKKIFTRKKDEEYAKLVGAYSDEEAYIEAFIETPRGVKPALSFLKEWFNQDSYGTLLIYGEPGHGKSMLCNKAVFEYCRGEFLPEAENVLSFTLNTGDNPNIIKDDKVNIEAILSWDDQPFSFEECRGALLFMDGFDELIDAAQKTNIIDIFSFMKKIERKADVYDIHIVVLSRTIAISEALEVESTIRNKCNELMPITEEQQDDWLDQHSEYIDYKEKLNAIRNNTDMSNLLGIPFLFRMIAHTRYDGISKNSVELYDNLINHLMGKRAIDSSDSKQDVIADLCDLAYDIYCNDTDTAIIEGDKRNSSWMIVFYIKQAGHGIYGFFHRTFYQYFLARYIYLSVLDINTDRQAETLIGAFAERELDDTVRQYLSLMIKEKDRETIHKNLKLVIEALVRTEAYLNLEPKYPNGKAEKTRIGRTINVYRNTLHICAAFSYVIEKSFKDGIEVFIKTYPSSNIRIFSDEKRRANLRKTYLSRASLVGADLSGADLSGADLSEANMNIADLTAADLHDAYLRETNLFSARMYFADLRDAGLYLADMRNAKLYSANLSRANLSEANLGDADLRNAKLVEANMEDANLNLADLSGAFLIRAKLGNANLTLADLKNANLTLADLSDADLLGADLSGANLSGADLSDANLKLTNLSGANLNYANLSRTKLSGAQLGVKSIDHAIIEPGNKDLFDPSIEGYETVRWGSTEDD